MSTVQSPLLGEAMQLAHVVRDLDAALRAFTGTLGIGPFLELTEVPPVDAIYRGHPTRPHLRMAWSFHGTTQIAVLQQLNEAPSPYLDFLRSRREGIEHVGYWPADAAAARQHLERNGLTRCYEVKTGGGVVYYDPPPGMDARIAIIEPSEMRPRIYGALQTLVRAWDGSDPVRRYPTMADFLRAQGIAGGW